MKSLYSLCFLLSVLTLASAVNEGDKKPMKMKKAGHRCEIPIVAKARVYIFQAVKGGLPNKVIGTIDFSQSGNNVKLNGTVSGLAPGEHGFHVHEKGDIGDGCLASGGHFNPHKMNHGAPSDSNRHIGDLGNIKTSENGETVILISDSHISLTNPQHSIIGRAVVIHEKNDDLGRGGSDLSLTTGNAGSRVACGVIAICEEQEVENSPLNVPNEPAAMQINNNLLCSYTVIILVSFIYMLMG